MHFKNLLPAAVVAIAIAGCASQDFKKTKGGMAYKQFTKSGAAQVKKDQWIKINYVVTVNNNGKDSVLNSTYAQGMPYYMPVTDQSQPYDISELIPMLHKGDSVIAIQSVDTFLKRTPDPRQQPPFFKKGGKLTTTFKVLDVFPDQQTAREDESKARDAAFVNDKKVQDRIKNEIDTIKQYLAANNIQATKTPMGTFVQVITPGNGPKAESGTYVDVFYTGRTLKGHVFDSNVDTSFHHPTPLSFQLGKASMFRGFTDGLLQLRQGDKARLYIPSPLGMGENAPPEIGANQILIFDVDLRSVNTHNPTAPAPAAPRPDASH
jgi:FKBP-type peptidyl-prolyl cis-trans isomerase FkpA